MREQGFVILCLGQVDNYTETFMRVVEKDQTALPMDFYKEHSVEVLDCCYTILENVDDLSKH